MFRFGKLATVICAMALVTPWSIDSTHVFRGERKNADVFYTCCDGPAQKAAGQTSKKNAALAPKAAGDMICPLSDMMHHDGYCDYYAMLCMSSGDQSPTGWQGPHGTPTGSCGSANCLPRFAVTPDGASKAALVHADDGLTTNGYERKSPNEAKKLEWDSAPAFNTTDSQKVKNVVSKYVTYHKKNKPNEVIHAQIIEFEASLDYGLHWEKMQSGFEIQPRSEVDPDVQYGKAETDEPHGHIHTLKNGTAIVTHKGTLDAP